MAYRTDLDALRTRQSILETEVAEREQELASTKRMIEEVQTRAKLPILDNIRVAAPCTAAWDAMVPVDGEDRVRACGDCNKNVYNLSDMTRDEAEALIVAKEGKLCIRYFQRTDGTILLKDCTIGTRQRRRRRIVAAGATMLAAAGIYGAAAKLRAEHARTELIDEGRYYAGGMAPLPTPPQQVLPTPQVDPAPPTEALPQAEMPRTRPEPGLTPVFHDELHEVKGRM